MGVVTNPVLTDPDSRCSAFCNEHHRLVSHSCPRPEQQSTDAGSRDMGNTTIILCSDRIAFAVDYAPLQIEETQSILRSHQLGQSRWGCAGWPLTGPRHSLL